MPLVLTMMLAVVLGALGSAMTLATATETLIAGAYRDGAALFYAADAATEFALGELARSDWRAALDSGHESTFIDRTPADSESLAGPSGYEIYASGRFGDMLGRPSSAVDPYVIVWIADLTGPAVDRSSERVVGILATAEGPAGGQRSITLTVRFRSSDEEVDGNGDEDVDTNTAVERLSWAQEP